MKKSIKNHMYTVLLTMAAVSIQSCDNGFEELNTNPDASSKVSPTYMFSRAQLDGAKDQLWFLLGTMQYTTSFNDVAGFGSKYVLSQSSQSNAVFNDAYTNEINEIGEVIRSVSTNTEQINLLAAARIWKAYCFSRITDLYGDIPYFQAAQGYTKAIYKPAYDPQEDIYADLLKELDEAAASFDVSKNTFGSADQIYGGDIAKWKKFAYSLMLRLGMRMTKVDIGTAEIWVKKAIAGGVITDDADIAKIGTYVSSGQDINKNPLVFELLNADYIKADGNSNVEGGKYQDVFIDFLKNNNDPRLPVFSVVYVAGIADTSAAIQKGMPATFSAKPANFVTYSEPNQKTLLQLNSPLFVLTNAEVHFLLAEAALRGWYTAATASSAYESGIGAAMRQWALFGSGGVISNAKINAYIADHALNTAGTMAEQMEQIYTQFWIGVFPDAQEVFSTYRRTGYPTLTPNNYTGNATGGNIFRRMLYPVSEQNLNAENYQASISRQGADDFMTRIWWDVQ